MGMGGRDPGGTLIFRDVAVVQPRPVLGRQVEQVDLGQVAPGHVVGTGVPAEIERHDRPTRRWRRRGRRRWRRRGRWRRWRRGCRHDHDEGGSRERPRRPVPVRRRDGHADAVADVAPGELVGASSRPPDRMAALSGPVALEPGVAIAPRQVAPPAARRVQGSSLNRLAGDLGVDSRRRRTALGGMRGGARRGEREQDCEQDGCAARRHASEPVIGRNRLRPEAGRKLASATASGRPRGACGSPEPGFPRRTCAAARP